MAQAIKNRIFGSDVPGELKEKIQLRQSLSKTSKLTDALDPLTERKKYNFPDSSGTNILADLSSRTPFTRMWAALKISEDIPWDGEGSKTVEGKDEVKNWFTLRDVNMKHGPETEKWASAYLKRKNKDVYEVRRIHDIPDSSKWSSGG